MARRPVTCFVTLALVLGAAAVSVSMALQAAAPKRRTRRVLPPGGVGGNDVVNIAPGEPRIYRIGGILPGTCYGKRKGRVVRVDPDGAIGMQFDAKPNAVIHPDGTFAFTAKVGAGSGLTPHTITVSGTFTGTTCSAARTDEARSRSTTRTRIARATSRSGRNGSANWFDALDC